MDGYPFMTTRAPAVLKTDSVQSHLLPAGRVQPRQAEEVPHLFVQHIGLQLHHFCITYTTPLFEFKRGSETFKIHGLSNSARLIELDSICRFPTTIRRCSLSYQ